jgi:O-Antigen ligase|tara:strand:+ start:51938 stop:53206 length:1269 start_codon:yes stop_codon:yes gene_type:complete
MNYSISLNKLYIFYVIFFAVIIDAIYGALALVGLEGLKISALYRAVLIFGFMVLLLKRSDIFSNWMRVIIILWLMSMLNLAISNKMPFPFLDIQIFFKVMFPFAVYYFLLFSLKNENLAMLSCRGISFFGAIAGLLFLFSIITGIGHQNYGVGRFGISSFFPAGNDIGIALILSLCFSWYLFLTTASNKYIVAVILTTLALLLSGTRAGILGAGLVNIIFVIVFLSRRYPNIYTSRNMTFKKIIFIILFAIIMFQVTTFIVDNIDVFAFQLEKLIEVSKALNPRENSIEHGIKYLKIRPLFETLYGSGVYFQVESAKSFSHAFGVNTERASFEQDTLDIFGYYGLILGGGILLLHYYFLVNAIGNFFMRPNLLLFTISIALGLLLVVGNLSGHGITSPQVGTIVGTIYYILMRKSDENINYK